MTTQRNKQTKHNQPVITPSVQEITILVTPKHIQSLQKVLQPLNDEHVESLPPLPVATASHQHQRCPQKQIQTLNDHALNSSTIFGASLRHSFAPEQSAFGAINPGCDDDSPAKPSVQHKRPVYPLKHQGVSYSQCEAGYQKVDHFVKQLKGKEVGREGDTHLQQPRQPREEKQAQPSTTTSMSSSSQIFTRRMGQQTRSSSRSRYSQQYLLPPTKAAAPFLLEAKSKNLKNSIIHETSKEDLRTRNTQAGVGNEWPSSSPTGRSNVDSTAHSLLQIKTDDSLFILPQTTAIKKLQQKRLSVNSSSQQEDQSFPTFDEYLMNYGGLYSRMVKRVLKSQRREYLKREPENISDVSKKLSLIQGGSRKAGIAVVKESNAALRCTLWTSSEESESLRPEGSCELTASGGGKATPTRGILPDIVNTSCSKMRQVDVTFEEDLARPSRVLFTRALRDVQAASSKQPSSSSPHLFILIVSRSPGVVSYKKDRYAETSDKQTVQKNDLEGKEALPPSFQKEQLSPVSIKQQAGARQQLSLLDQEYSLSSTLRSSSALRSSAVKGQSFIKQERRKLVKSLHEKGQLEGLRETLEATQLDQQEDLKQSTDSLPSNQRVSQSSTEKQHLKPLQSSKHRTKQHQ